jgi:hypothetical protein
MLETYDKTAQAKRNTAEYKKDRMMQEEWLKKNKPTTCSIAQNFNVPTEIPEVYDDDNS